MQERGRREVFTSLFGKKDAEKHRATSSFTCKDSEGLHVKAKIDILACMAWHHNMCQSCLDACDVRAISFLGLFRPHINEALCNGCDRCTKLCPSNAIHLYQKEES
ncbi:4Fe-4S binding protein [Sulfurospirillum barnesii]|uniref:4Fe-4S binding protein n=1 Tax=Sulfurospirillum barnesii TaxID=44674 RepID=UPI0003010790|nr:4Fe-4S binding protein [Sulfurospirillum barnesii]